MLFFSSKDRGPKILGVGLYRGKEYVGPWSCIVYAGEHGLGDRGVETN